MSLGGSQTPPTFGKVRGPPMISSNFPGSSLATSPELLSLWLLTGENQTGTGGRGRDRKCHKLSQIVVTFYDEFMTIYDVL